MIFGILRSLEGVMVRSEALAQTIIYELAREE
jgi:hypothetical protein